MLNKKSILSIVASMTLVTGLFGAKVTALKSSIAEETFQMLIVNAVLEKIGHEIESSNDVNYDIAYQTIASNADSEDVYFLASMWDPLHNGKLKALGGDKKLVKYDKFISNCAQGYLVDKKTADKYNIKYVNDLDKPEIAKLFDSNGNGKADLTGCSGGWGCSKVIEYQLDAFGLRDNIDHNQGSYSALIADTIARYKTGKPIFYYTWTPYWVSGKLVPGKDVVFLQVTKSANADGYSTKLPNGADYGFAVNNQKIVANKSCFTVMENIGNERNLEQWSS